LIAVLTRTGDRTVGTAGQRRATVRGARCAIVAVRCWTRHTTASDTRVIGRTQVAVFTSKRVVHKDTVAKGAAAAVVSAGTVVIAGDVLADATAACTEIFGRTGVAVIAVVVGWRAVAALAADTGEVETVVVVAADNGLTATSAVGTAVVLGAELAVVTRAVGCDGKSAARTADTQVKGTGIAVITGL
jgi:hypothetical protein